MAVDGPFGGLGWSVRSLRAPEGRGAASTSPGGRTSGRARCPRCGRRGYLRGGVDGAAPAYGWRRTSLKSPHSWGHAWPGRQGGHRRQRPMALPSGDTQGSRARTPVPDRGPAESRRTPACRCPTGRSRQGPGPGAGPSIGMPDQTSIRPHERSTRAPSPLDSPLPSAFLATRHGRTEVDARTVPGLAAPGGPAARTLDGRLTRRPEVGWAVGSGPAGQSAARRRRSRSASPGSWSRWTPRGASARAASRPSRRGAWAWGRASAATGATSSRPRRRRSPGRGPATARGPHLRSSATTRLPGRRHPAVSRRRCDSARAGTARRSTWTGRTCRWTRSPSSRRTPARPARRRSWRPPAG